jgi:uncharacterized protein
MNPGKPPSVFDRDWEWDQLRAFAGGRGLGVVSGRRRHGKSYLLRELASTHGAFYHQAIEIDRRTALDRFALALAERRGWPAPPRFDDWEQALRAAFDTSDQFVLIDEFPYLLGAAPELLSVIQLLVDDWRHGARGHRLVLCGSSLSVMSTVLGGGSPLHGRATLDLTLNAFDYRTAASFWRAPDERTAFVVDAIFGGAPGYRELMDGRLPHRPDELGEWLATGPLNPAHVLFSEDDYLLREETRFTDRAHYLSILQAVANGATTTSALAAALGRDARSLHHSLNGLVRAGFLESLDDALRDQRPVLRVVDPLVRFCRLVTRPSVDRLEQHRWAEVMAERARAVSAGIFGPHFEHLCREWTRRFAPPVALGGTPSRVAPAVINDAKSRAKLQLDVVAVASGHGERPRVLAIGEAKFTTALRTMADVSRLERARELVRATRSNQFEVNDVKIMLFSGAGFDVDTLRNRDRRGDLLLVDLPDLYYSR